RAGAHTRVPAEPIHREDRPVRFPLRSLLPADAVSARLRVSIATADSSGGESSAHDGDQAGRAPPARGTRHRVSGFLPPTARAPPKIPVRVQIALYPHAGYSRDRFVLDRSEVDPAHAYLIDVDVNA